MKNNSHEQSHEEVKIRPKNDRLTPYSTLICHLDLGWGDNDNPCRQEVENNPNAIRHHMMNKHGFKVIPELAQRECKNEKDEVKKARLYLDKPEEWFLDNQFIWRDIRNFHFRQKTSKGLRNLRSLSPEV